MMGNAQRSELKLTPEQIEHRMNWLKQTVSTFNVLNPDTEAEIDSIRDMAIAGLTAREEGVVCCNDWANCRIPCTPRGEMEGYAAGEKDGIEAAASILHEPWASAVRALVRPAQPQEKKS